jgi:glycerol uptake operon antiterminator
MFLERFFMISKQILSKFKEYPVIAGVRTQEDYASALDSRVKIIFMVGGDVFKVQKEMSILKDKGGLLFLHMDLIEGIGKDPGGIHFAKEQFGIDGIISTKTNILKIAKEEKLITVHRIFLMDFQALNSGMNLIKLSHPDFIELTPGVIPRVVKKVSKENSQPVITSGLISSEEDVRTMIRSGASNIVCSCRKIWNMVD